jgi:hypothetical protein
MPFLKYLSIICAYKKTQGKILMNDFDYITVPATKSLEPGLEKWDQDSQDGYAGSGKLNPPLSSAPAFST